MQLDGWISTVESAGQLLDLHMTALQVLPCNHLLARPVASPAAEAMQPSSSLVRSKRHPPQQVRAPLWSFHGLVFGDGPRTTLSDGLIRGNIPRGRPRSNVCGGEIFQGRQPRSQ